MRRAVARHLRHQPARRVDDFIDPALLDHRRLPLRVSSLSDHPSGRRPTPVLEGHARANDESPSFARARSSGATVAARSTTSRCATTSSSSSFATRSSPTRSTAAWRCLAGPDWTRGRTHRSLQRLSLLRASSRAGPSASWRAGEEWLRSITRRDCTRIYLGDEAIVNCQTSRLEGGKMKGLRQACTRLARHGYTVEFLDPANDRSRPASRPSSS